VCFQRRLRRGYSRFGDARPGRHQIGSGGFCGGGGSPDQEEQNQLRSTTHGAGPHTTADKLHAASDTATGRAGVAMEPLNPPVELGPETVDRDHAETRRFGFVRPLATRSRPHCSISGRSGLRDPTAGTWYRLAGTERYRLDGTVAVWSLH
jgi:hypothetical protein